MRTITLRTLVREPIKVKRWTATGQAVQVTDNGRPLWIVQPATETAAGAAERRRAIDEILDEVLAEKPSKVKLSTIIKDSRR